MKNILIVVIGNTGNEPEALRQSLEYFGYFVAVKYIGRPNDFIGILNGDPVFDPDSILLSCHGVNAEIIMPVLGDSVYEPDEPRGSFSASEIKKHLLLQEKLILNLGCTTGKKDMAAVFSKHNTYIASDDYTDGNAALYFAITLFYEMSKAGATLEDAFRKAKGIDDNTALFRLFPQQE